jgi:hypothetical protein
MNNKMNKLITVLAVLGLVFALAPAAQADILYTENFVGTTHTESLGATVGWTGDGAINVGQVQAPPAVDSDWHDLVGTPDTDNWHAAKWVAGASGRLWMTTSEYTIQASDRHQTQFSVDFAAKGNGGLRWVAKVGSTWYGTDAFGTGTDHGDVSEHAVKEWVAGQTLDVESAAWYVWMSPPGDAGLSGTSESLPAGDITSFGIALYNNNNSDAWAVDNFRVTTTPVGTMLIIR